MTKRVLRRRGSETDHSTFTGEEGEFTYDTTLKTIRAHDGIEVGGFTLVRDADSTPDPTSDTVMRRDADGRAQVENPTSSKDIANKDFVDSVVNGLDWQESVIAQQNTPAVSPSEGDRYLIGSSPSGDWSGHANEIAEYLNGSWEFVVPDDGFALIRESDDTALLWNGTSWINFGSSVKHNVTQELQGGTTDEYYHLTSAEYTAFQTMDANGLDNLTASEVSQLENINNETISNTQWGYLGGLGSAPLENNDLAANGGTVPEVDRENTFDPGQVFNNGLIWFRSSDPNFLAAVDSSGDLQLRTDTSGNRIKLSGAGNGGTFGSGNTGFRGPGAWDAEELYDNGNRVYSASNAPAFSDVLGDIGDGQVPTTAVTQHLLLTSDRTVNIPTDYPDLQAAFDDQIKWIPNGFTITLNIESGHALTNALDVRRVDAGHFIITSDDATVLLDGGFTPANPPSDESFTANQNCIFFTMESRAPIWSILVDAQNADVTGIHYMRSYGNIDPGCGVDNPNRMALAASKTSHVFAHECILRNSGEGIRISEASVFNGPAGDYSGFRNLSSSNSRAAMEVSRGAIVNMSSNNISAAANLSNSAGDAIYARRSVVMATNADLSNAGGSGVKSDFGSQVCVDGSIISGCAGRAINSGTGSIISANDTDLTNAGQEAVFSVNGSKVTVNNADVTGFDSSSSGADACEVFSGSIITANGVSGSPTFNIPVNGVYNDGIIFN